MRGWKLRNKLHVSWQLAVACGSIVLGVVAAKELPQGMFASLAWLLTGLALVLTAAYKQRVLMVLLAITGGLLIGIWRGSLAADDARKFDDVSGRTVVVTGVVSDDSETNKRGQLVLRVQAKLVDGRPMHGAMWLTTNDPISVRRGDVITATGKASEGFGSFVLSLYSAKVNSVARPQPGDVAVGIRDWFAGGVRQAIAEPESNLGLGYLVGQRRGLPEDLQSALTAAGLTHIVVASGYNLTILVRLARRLFEKVSKYLSLLASGGMIVSFIAITGLSPSMSRAGLVAGLGLIAWYYGRRFHPLVLLPLAMAVTVLIQPSYAWGDLGWQLSFAAFAGVMIMAPLIQNYFFGDKPERTLRRIFIETIAAQIWTVPILLLSFGQLSIVAPVANILILPLVPLAMLFTFVAGIAGLVVPALAEIVGFPAQALLTYMTTTAKFMGSLPWASHEAAITEVGAVLMYVGIIGFCLYAWYATKLQLERTSLIE